MDALPPNIPHLLRHYANVWSLTLGERFESSYSYVVAADADKVLKLSFPSERVEQEARALRAFAGHGAVALLEHDAAALLLQRALSGNTLAAIEDDNAAIDIAASVAARLWTAAPAGQPTLETWIADLNRLRDFAPELADDAVKVASSLLATAAERVLLHGDFHHGNILQNHDGWLAIDPVGLIGERACDVASLILNPAHRLTRDLVAARIERLSAKLDLDPHRVRQWTFVRAAIGVLWCFEDRSSPPPQWIECVTY